MACGCGCNENKQLSGYSPDSQNFLSATNGMGALFSGGIFSYLIVGTAAFLIGGKLQSGKWYWQKNKMTLSQYRKKHLPKRK